VVLCRFNDVPALDIPRAKFFDFVSEYGRGGLFDYWRDASYGAISLAGSEVFGWYTMKYSFVNDSADPFKNGTQGRFAWIAEAIRLSGEAGVDLSRFYGVIAVMNANADDSNAGRNTAMGIGGAWGQTNWRWCSKCQGLAYGGNLGPGRCPAGGTHDLTSSSNYALSINDAGFPGQDNWRWCKKCQGLADNGGPSPGPCPAGALHDHSSSADYRLGTGKVGYGGQNDWRWCRRCQGLTYAAGAPGPCPAGGSHDHTGSADYTLVGVGSGLNSTFNAHETGHGYGLPHSWSANPDVEYGDPWDIMSAMRVRTFDNRDYPPAGPELNAHTRYKMGWLGDDRTFTYTVMTGGTILQVGQKVDLVALNRPEIPGYLIARVLTPNHVYTVEFRQPTGWDRGIGRECVLIHESRSNYTTGQTNWRWCSKCQGLTYCGAAICPAGGVHDHATSGNYKLTINDPAFSGQHNWRWCRRCQGLAYAAGAPAPARPAEVTITPAAPITASPSTTAASPARAFGNGATSARAWPTREAPYRAPARPAACTITPEAATTHSPTTTRRLRARTSGAGAPSARDWLTTATHPAPPEASTTTPAAATTVSPSITRIFPVSPCGDGATSARAWRTPEIPRWGTVRPEASTTIPAAATTACSTTPEAPTGRTTGAGVGSASFWPTPEPRLPDLVPPTAPTITPAAWITRSPTLARIAAS
jgi:hypothetical protein